MEEVYQVRLQSWFSPRSQEDVCDFDVRVWQKRHTGQSQGEQTLDMDSICAHIDHMVENQYSSQTVQRFTECSLQLASPDDSTDWEVESVIVSSSHWRPVCNLDINSSFISFKLIKTKPSHNQISENIYLAWHWKITKKTSSSLKHS